MSDLLEGVQREAQAIRKGYTPQQSGLLSAVDQEAQAIRQAEERKRAFMYGIPMSDSDYEIISTGIASSPNPDEERWNWGAALMYSQRLGVDVATAKQNLEGISSAWLANPMNYKGESHFEAIVDSFRAGDIQMEAGELAKQWRDGGGSDAGLQRRLDELYGEMEKLQDHWPRNLVVDILKAGAQTAPFMVQTVGAGAMAAGAATLAIGALGGTAATAGIAAPVGAAATAAAMKAFAFSAGSFMASFNKMSALEYYEMRRQGISHDVANTWSAVSGGAQAMIETALGNVPGLIGKVGGETVTSISGKIAKKLFLSGKWGAAARAIMSYGGEVIEEGVEEALQSIVSDVSKNIAADLEDKGIPKTEAADIAKNAVEQFKGGALASVGMGLPGAFIGYKQAAKQSKALTELASAMDKDDFIYEASKWEGVADMPEKARKDALGDLWERQQKRKAQEAEEGPKATTEADVEVEEDGTEPTDVRRTKEGTIRTELGEQRTNADGSTTAIVKAGEPDAPGRYGYARYTIDRDTIRIDSVKVKESIKDKAEVRRALVLEIAAQNPGLDIQWDTKSEDNQAVKDRLTKENPRGVNAGLQWYGADEKPQETRTRHKFRADILSSFKNVSTEQADAITALAERRAARVGLSLEEYRNKYISGITTETPEGVLAAQKTGKRILGATVIRDGKALVYAAKTADFSTLAHEFMHVWENEARETGGEDLATLEKAFGIEPGKWTDADRERVAYTWEEFLRTGKAKTPELQNIFQRIAEWMVNIYRKISGKIAVSDEIAEALEGLFRDPASPLSEAARTKAQELTSMSEKTRQAGQDETVFQYAGENAILDDIEKQNLSVAKEMDAAGKDSETIRLATGWFKGKYDGKWRIELDDKAVVHVYEDRIIPGKPVPLSDVLQYPALYKRYPDLAEIPVSTLPEYTTADSIAAIGEGKAGEKYLLITPERAGNQWELSKVVLHEVQHLVQEKEGFARGSSPFEFQFDERKLQAYRYYRDASILSTMKARTGSVEEAVKQFQSRMKRDPEPGATSILDSYSKEELSQLAEDNRPRTTMEQYTNTAGEIEARDVESRYSLSPEQRRATPPYSSENIAAEDAVVLFQEAPPLDSPAFREWFGDSKVVDESGNPLVVYHGGQSNLDSFKKGARRGVNGLAYFTDSPSTASRYALGGGIDDNLTIADYIEKAIDNDIVGLITPVYLSIKNPLTDKITFNQIIQEIGRENIENELRNQSVSIAEALDDGASLEDILDSEDWSTWIQGEDSLAFSKSNELSMLYGSGLIFKMQMFDGMIYNDAETGSRTFVIYSSNQAKSIFNRNPTSDDRLLFQSEDALRSEARTFDTWREFMEYVEATDSQEDKAVEALPQEEREKWYRDFWKSAQAEKQKPISPQEADERFTSRIETNEGLDDFLAEINNILTFTVEDAPQDPEEQAYYEKRLDLQKRIKAMHPTVLNNATRVGLGRPITDRARAAIETLMKSGATYYRRLYAEIMDDASLQNVDKEQEAQALPRIEDPEEAKDWEAASIVNRVKIAKAIKNAEIKKRLMSGEIVPEKEMQDVIAEQDAKIAELEATVKVKEAEIADDYKTFTSHEKTFVEQKARIKELSDDLAKTERTISRLVERGQAVSEALTSARQEAALQLKSAKAQLAAVRATERTKAREAKQAAIDEVRAKIKEAQEKRADAKKVINLKKTIANQIMRPTTVAISYDKRLQIEALQSIIDPHFRRAQIKWRGEMYNIEELRNNTQFLQDAALEKKLIDRLTKKPLNEWTIEELEKLNDEIQRLRDQGIQEWAAVIQERKAAAIRSASAIASQAFKSGKYEEPAAAGSAERALQIKRKNSLWRQIQMKTLNAARIANLLDGGKDGENTRLLVKESREAYAEKMNNLDRRAAPIMEALEKAGYKGANVAERAKELWERKYTIDKVGPDQSSVTMTADDLMYIAIALKDEHSRAAILYGNFASEKERLMQDEMALKSWGMTKEQILRDAIKKHLTAADMAIVDAVQADYTREFGRLNNLFIEEFNVAMKQVGFYVPLVRETTASMDTAHEKQQAEEVLNVGGISIRRNPDKGFTHERVNIKPKNQRAVKLGLVATWLTAVEREEHFHAYTPYIRHLNRVYKSNSAHSRQVRDAIVNTYGTEAFKYIENYINEQANPKSFSDAGLNKLVRGLRGDLGSAYLGWKLSGVVKQLITSPIPYSAYVSPLSMVRSAFTYASNPKAFDDFIKERSAIMRHRVQNPVIQVIKEGLADPKTAQKFAQFKAIGIKGLELADWVSVATGWRAAYDSAIAKGQTEQEASAYADDVTLKCQPSARPEDLAPLFKTGSEFTRAFTQFQSALNVIWNQVSYDIPTAFKNKQFGYAFRQISAYVVAGILLGLVTRGKEDDDDTKADDFLYWSLTQFTDSVPLIGSQVNSLWRQVSTGEKSTPYSSSLMPALDESMAALRDISEGDWGNAAKNFGEGVGLFLGAPVSGVKEIVKTVEEGPGALVGRRRK